MALNDPSVEQTLRVYLSDDDFDDEGNLGHHQGDITFVDGSGIEQGWVSAGSTWVTANLLSSRGSTVVAGGTDPETSHLRGLFGNGDLWNQTAFMQGSNQDIFVMAGPLNLTVDSDNQTVTFSFDVSNSWFYEDFDDNQLFNPCDGLDGCAGNAEWSPIFNNPDILIN